MEENRIPIKVLYMNLETTRFREWPRNRWQDEVREDGRIFGGEGWQEKVYNEEEWKKLLKVTRNRRILYMPMEWMNALIHGLSNNFIFFLSVLEHRILNSLFCYMYLQIHVDFIQKLNESHTYVWLFCLVLFFSLAY